MKMLLFLLSIMLTASVESKAHSHVRWNELTLNKEWVFSEIVNKQEQNLKNMSENFDHDFHVLIKYWPSGSGRQNIKLRKCRQKISNSKSS